jgi:hypothetical protein
MFDNVGFAPRPSNEPVLVTPPESQEARTRVLLAASGFGAAALILVGALVFFGLRRSDKSDLRFAPRSTATSRARGDQARRTAERRSDALSAELASPRLFSPTSFWNQRLPAAAALDPESRALVAALVAEIQRERAAGIGPWIGAGAGSTPVYRVPASQPRVRVRLARGNLPGRRALQRAFASVPVPRDAKAAPGLDRHLTVWQPSRDELWEFFKARRHARRWHADWGGAIRRVAKSPGYYTASAWPGAGRHWGATASSLPMVGGTILLDELRKGRINHALAINLPAARARQFAWPAQRTDGTGPPTALPEGAHLRLDPTVNVADLGLPKLGRMIARAAQRYGIVVRDQTGHGTSFWLEVPTRRTGTRGPYNRYLRGKTPAEVLANFPWDRLQVLAMHLCRAAPCNKR